MKKNALLTSFAICLMVIMASCLKQEEPVEALQLNLPEQAYDYAGVQLPPHFQNDFLSSASNVFVNNGGIVVDFPNNGDFFSGIPNPTITNDGATLGRVLFYDTKLSINNAVSCASCHKQQFAFADPTAGSIGFEGKVTPRNSMAIINVALNRNLFWDSRVHSAKELTLKPVQNHIEMGMEDLQVLVSKLSKTSYYPELFRKAFGTSTITEDRISDAMAQFLCSMVSVDSRFDAQFSSNQPTTFNELEHLGQSLFFSERTKCAKCHSGNNFAADDRPGGEYGDIGFDFGGGNDNSPKGTANNGLDLVTTDKGLRDGQFRIPSLRNVALTGPYMHDGRLETLEDVIEFYNSGVKLHTNLDKKLIGPDGEPLRLNLSSLEKKAMVAFLETLTDQTLVTDVKYSNPFH